MKIKKLIKNIRNIILGATIVVLFSAGIVHADKVFTLPDQTGQAGKFLQTNGTNPLWATAGGGGGGTVTQINTQDSITGGPITTSGTINLVNDSNAPGDSMYYGTDSGGTKGFFTLPGSTPAAPDTSVQFNNSGAFGGTDEFTFVQNNLAQTYTLNLGTANAGDIGNIVLGTTAGNATISSPGSLALQGGSNSLIQLTAGALDGAWTGIAGEDASFSASDDGSGNGLFTISTANSIGGAVSLGVNASTGITFSGASGSYTFPQNNGTAGQVLTDDGSGNLSWGTPASTLSIGETVTSGTDPAILFIQGGLLAQDPTNFGYVPATSFNVNVTDGASYSSSHVLSTTNNVNTFNDITDSIASSSTLDATQNTMAWSSPAGNATVSIGGASLVATGYGMEVNDTLNGYQYTYGAGFGTPLSIPSGNVQEWTSTDFINVSSMNLWPEGGSGSGGGFQIEVTDSATNNTYDTKLSATANGIQNIYNNITDGITTAFNASSANGSIDYIDTGVAEANFSASSSGASTFFEDLTGSGLVAASQLDDSQNTQKLTGNTFQSQTSMTSSSAEISFLNGSNIKSGLIASDSTVVLGLLSGFGSNITQISIDDTSTLINLSDQVSGGSGIFYSGINGGTPSTISLIENGVLGASAGTFSSTGNQFSYTDPSGIYSQIIQQSGLFQVAVNDGGMSFADSIVANSTSISASFENIGTGDITGWTIADLSTTFTNAVALAPQYDAPMDGDTITSNSSTQLILDPAGSLVAVTIVLPSSPVDGQQFWITSTNTITTVTFSGGTVVGNPAGIALGMPEHYVYSGGASEWILN